MMSMHSNLFDIRALRSLSDIAVPQVFNTDRELALLKVIVKFE